MVSSDYLKAESVGANIPKSSFSSIIVAHKVDPDAALSACCRGSAGLSPRHFCFHQVYELEKEHKCYLYSLPAEMETPLRFEMSRNPFTHSIYQGASASVVHCCVV